MIKKTFRVKTEFELSNDQTVRYYAVLQKLRSNKLLGKEVTGTLDIYSSTLSIKVGTGSSIDFIKIPLLLLDTILNKAESTCDCGAEHTSNPNYHYPWCSSGKGK